MSIEVQGTIVCTACKARAPVTITGGGKFGFYYKVPDGWLRKSSLLSDVRELCPACQPKPTKLPDAIAAFERKRHR
jgi:hypothetical protein